MEDVRALHLQILKARVSGADYEVDPAAVAEAMLRRPSSWLWLVSAARLSPEGRRGRERPGPSGDVLESS